MAWSTSWRNATGRSLTSTPHIGGLAERFIQLDGYHSIIIQEVGNRVRRTGTTSAVVVYDGFHNFELGYEGCRLPLKYDD